MITDWATLRASWKEWHGRQDSLDAMYPDFLQLVEARANSEIRHWRMELRETATIVVTTSPRYLPLPQRWREGINVEAIGTSGGTNTPLDYVPPKELDEWRLANPGSGKIQKFTVIADRLEFAKDAGEDTEIEMLYYASIPALVETEDGAGNLAIGPENWLCTHYPHVYLWGLLAETHAHLWDEARQQVYEQRYRQAVAAINAEGQRALRIGPATRTPGRTFG